MSETTLVWLRIDLRLADNPALHAAVKAGGAVVPPSLVANGPFARHVRMPGSGQG